MWFKTKKQPLFLFLLFLLALFTRFYRINWGGGFYFHPDENNMARSVSQLRLDNLNPHFFAYGQFPLYLAYASGIAANLLGGHLLLSVNFSQAIFWLRFWSALFSLLTVIIGYFLGKRLFKSKKLAWIYTILLIFAPGLIQAAHFGTTESLLTFILLALTYFSIRLFEEGLTLKDIILVGMLVGIGLATKISAALFLFSLWGCFGLAFTQQKKRYRWLWGWLAVVFLSGIFLFLFSPFYLLKWKEALPVLRYETDVARGRLLVFYTLQFVKSRPVLFQLIKIFPWVLGLPMYFLFLVALLYLFFRGLCLLSYSSGFRLLKSLISNPWLIVYLFWLPWFLFNAFLFSKWVRFMIPVVPFLILLIVELIKELEVRIEKRRSLLFLLYGYLLLSVAPGILFLKVYFFPDTRVYASEWMSKNLPQDTIVLSESGNVVDLPLFGRKNFRVINFDFYHLEDSQERQEELDSLVQKADYILLPSRRVFANYIPLASQLPQTAEFYQKLFSGKLGFVLLKEFKIFNGWEEVLLGSDLTSEETWTVFDHPTIRLFKAEKKR
jgi:4-amino-4-deoxy-L-arabinose transferase-like glycosyltransferase